MNLGLTTYRSGTFQMFARTPALTDVVRLLFKFLPKSKLGNVPCKATSITINKKFCADKHRDVGNCGVSFIVGFNGLLRCGRRVFLHGAEGSSMPACTTDGDLDGDLYFVMWSKKTIADFNDAWTAPEQPSVANAQEHLSDVSLLSEGKFMSCRRRKITLQSGCFQVSES